VVERDEGRDEVYRGRRRPHGGPADLTYTYDDRDHLVSGSIDQDPDFEITSSFSWEWEWGPQAVESRRYRTFEDDAGHGFREFSSSVACHYEDGALASVSVDESWVPSEGAWQRRAGTRWTRQLDDEGRLRCLSTYEYSPATFSSFFRQGWRRDWVHDADGRFVVEREFIDEINGPSSSEGYCNDWVWQFPRERTDAIRWYDEAGTHIATDVDEYLADGRVDHRACHVEGCDPACMDDGAF
jgi:hypothetical protein